MDDSTIPSILFLAILHLLLILVITVFLVWQFVRIWQAKVKYRAEKLVAVGITAFMFPAVFYEALIVPIFSLIANLERLFYLFLYYSSLNDAPDIKVKRAASTDQISVLFSPIIKSFPLAGFLEIVAMMTIIYYLARQITAGRITIPKLFTEKGKNVKLRILILNTCISFCLLFSIYFVISVCVTIPYLNEMKKPSGVTQKMLDSTLTIMSKADTIQFKSIPTAPFSANFTKDSLAADKFASLSASKQSLLLGEINSFQVETKFTLQSRAELTRKISDFYDGYKKSNSRIMGDISRTFQSNSNNIAIDKNVLYKDLVDAFENYLSVNNQNYTDAVAGLLRADAANSTVNLQVSDGIKSSMASMLKDTGNYYNYYYNNSNTVNGIYQPYSGLLRTSNLININTNYERNGSDWGPLGWSAGYLIRTKSLDLVLLVGMIGFGILGASILSFVPMNDFLNSFTHHAMIKNFPNVLARGFGAALIIYMATKGGLAIFTMGSTQDPNGYILLLTCFVGAVFSEKVWNKVSNMGAPAAPPAPPPHV